MKKKQRVLTLCLSTLSVSQRSAPPPIRHPILRFAAAIECRLRRAGTIKLASLRHDLCTQRLDI